MIKNRNQKILTMREQGITLGELSKKFKLSIERIRQIVSFEPNYCVRHSKSFLNNCPYCEIELTYKEIYSQKDLESLLKEGKKLSSLGREKVNVLKKRIFVNILRDKYKHNFSAIGRILKKHRTTITNLYN
jgi:Mor family transcriptional regulator